MSKIKVNACLQQPEIHCCHAGGLRSQHQLPGEVPYLRPQNRQLHHQPRHVYYPPEHNWPLPGQQCVPGARSELLRTGTAVNAVCWQDSSWPLKNCIKGLQRYLLADVVTPLLPTYSVCRGRAAPVSTAGDPAACATRTQIHAFRPAGLALAQPQTARLGVVWAAPARWVCQRMQGGVAVLRSLLKEMVQCSAP